MKLEKHIQEFRNYLANNEKAESTTYNYCLSIKHMLQYLDKDPMTINIQDINNYQTYFKSKITNKRYLLPTYASINQWIELMVKVKKNSNLVDITGTIYKLKLNIKKGKMIAKSKRVPLTIDELNRLFDSARNNLCNYAILKTMYYLCTRRGELIALNLEDYDQKEQTMYVFDQKTDNPNNEPNEVPDDLKVALENYLEIRNPKQHNPKHLQRLQELKQLPVLTESQMTEYARLQKEYNKIESSQNALFINDYGYRVGRGQIYNLVKRYGAKAGIRKNIFPHILRHTRLSILGDQGYTMKQLQTQSRHQTIEILSQYVHPSRKIRREIANCQPIVHQPHPEQPKPTPPKPPEPIGPTITQSDSKLQDLEMKLIEQLANGEISNKVYNDAIQRLHNFGKSKQVGNQDQMYG